MEWLSSLLTDPMSVSHIVLVYAFVVALGMAAGHVKVFGVSLGVTCVLFVGLIANYAGFAVNPTILGFTRDFGLILFVFFIGLQVGPSFFSAFRSGGVQLNLLTVLCVVLSIAVTIAIYFILNGSVGLPQLLGTHYGAVTNTPGLGATQEALDSLGYKGEDIAVAYACAYPLGVLAIIGVAVFLKAVFRVDVKKEEEEWEREAAKKSGAPIYFHVNVENPAVDGRTIRDIRTLIGRDFICSRVSRGGEVTSPNADTVLKSGDILRIVAEEDNKEAIAAFCGRENREADLNTAHSPVAAQVIRVTKASVNGIRLSDLHLSHFDGVNITRVFRAGMTLFPHSGLHLQIGDGVYCVGPEKSLRRLADTLGNKESRLDHPNIVSIFLGIGLGIILGSIPLALPGMPAPLKIGLAGGPLIVAILLGHFGPRLHLITYTTHSASLMLQEFGIALFLASVGLGAGTKFVEALSVGNGFLYMGLGLFITLIPLLIVGVLARVKFRLNYHSIVGMLAGATTDPPMLAYANMFSEKGIPSISYSTVYPLAMFLRIITGQLVLLAMWSFI